MSLIKIQGAAEKQRRIYYQLDTSTPPIGEGGMGKVFKGIQVDEKNGSTRPVAIKFMFEDLPPNAYERARRESEIQLRNDNLIEMLGFIETQETTITGEVRKRYHVVSELLEGVSLSDILEGKTKDKEGNEVPYAVKMLQDYQHDPEHFALVIVINVLSGLMALHDAGYIHRDIDPSNIMLTAEGRIKLIDFGIAKQMNNLTTGDKSLTVAGKFMGKPEYAAPELALGDIAHQNQTTDIYAVGILLFQCIIGHTPFEGARHEILEMQLKSKLPLHKIKNKSLRKIIATACEKKQELRYQSSAQMRVALETINNTKQKPKKNNIKFIVVITAGVAAIIICTIMLIMNQRVKEEQRLAEAHRIELQIKTYEDSIQALTDKAEFLITEGLSKESDNYEDKLIEAYFLYEKAETNNIKKKEAAVILKKVAGIQYQIGDFKTKKSELIMLLTSMASELKGQAESLAEIGEAELSQSFTIRTEKIEKFISSHKQNKSNETGDSII